MKNEDYRDKNGNPISLEDLVREEPEWAVSLIRRYAVHMKAVNESLERIKEIALSIK